MRSESFTADRNVMKYADMEDTKEKRKGKKNRENKGRMGRKDRKNRRDGEVKSRANKTDTMDKRNQASRAKKEQKRGEPNKYSEQNVQKGFPIAIHSISCIWLLGKCRLCQSREATLPCRFFDYHESKAL